jgi:hypothetical protein
LIDRLRTDPETKRIAFIPVLRQAISSTMLGLPRFMSGRFAHQV